MILGRVIRGVHMMTNFAGLNYISLYLELLILIAPVSGLIYCDSFRRNIKLFDVTFSAKSAHDFYVGLSLCLTRVHSIFSNEWLTRAWIKVGQEGQVCNPWFMCEKDP